MTDLTDSLDARVGNAFASAAKTAAIAEALIELKLTDGDSVDDDKNAVNLAQAILVNQRIMEKSKTDSSLIVQIKSMAQLIEELQLIPSQSEKRTNYNIIQYKQPDSSLHYSRG